MKLIFFRTVLVLVMIALTAPMLNAQQKKKVPPAKNYTVSEAQSKIKIDGNLDEPAWETATKMDLPYESFPGDNTPAPVKTECLVTFSKSKVYIGFRCFDPDPKKIRAHLMDRDAMAQFVQDDYVILLLDTFNDERRAFQFRVNPLGVQADASFSELEGFEDFSWDAIWASHGKITDFGYVVEIAIPFNQLRFAKTDKEQVWGISVQRSYPRTVRSRMASYATDRARRCMICQFNKLTGFKGISPGRNLEFDPTLTVNRTDKPTETSNGELESGKVDVEPGLNMRWGITPNLIANATVNPDFSQVEADVAQLEVNTRFALQYPEKRPFFLEGADFFLTPMQAVFTRTVHDPVWGAKMTGKIGKNAVGFFTAQDRYNNIMFPSNQGSMATALDDDVFSSVLRYRRDIGKGSTIGALYTGRMGDNYYNHVIGADGFFRLGRSKVLICQYLHSSTDYPDEVAATYQQDSEAFDGDAFSVDFIHWGRNVRYGAFYKEMTGTFRADYGFIPRVDTRTLRAFVEPVLWSKKRGWFHRIAFLVQGERINNCENDLSDQDFRLTINYQGPMQAIVMPTLALQKEYYFGQTYDKTLFQNYMEIRPAGGLKFSLFSQIGDTIDYANARKADLLLLQPKVNFAIGKHINVSLDHTLQRLSLKGDKIYTANLSQAKVIYNFNIRTLFRVILQYMDLSRNADMFMFPVSESQKTLFTQFLFSYKINPHTKLFLGYSDNHLGMKGISLNRTNRTFFLKVGYALVL